MTRKGVLPEKDLLEKAATMRRFEYSPVELELKVQTNVAEKRYQKLNNIFESDDKKEEPVTIKQEEPVTIKKEKPVAVRKETLEIIHNPKLVYNSRYSVFLSQNIKDWLSFIID